MEQQAGSTGRCQVLHIEAGGRQSTVPYDKLILATGAAPREIPLLPPSTSITERPFVSGLRTLQDMDRITQLVRSRTVRHAVVVGAGFVGLEVAEALVRQNVQVVVVEAAGRVLAAMDGDMTTEVHNELLARGVVVHVNSTVTEVTRGTARNPSLLVLNSGVRLPADLVLTGVGVRPQSELAASAGLTINARGAIVVNAFQQTSDPDIYAVGDVVETRDPVLGRRLVAALAGPANRQARVAADHILLGPGAVPYPGTLGSAIVRVGNMVAGSVGWTEAALRRERVPYRVAAVNATAHASYYPNAAPLRGKITWSPDTGRVLGGQFVGTDGVDKRLDALSTALTGRLTVDDLAYLEFAYAPPYASAKDVLNLLGAAASNEWHGLVRTATLAEAPQTSRLVVDVRGAALARRDPYPFQTVNIPFDDLRARLRELDRAQPILAACNQGKTSYFAR